MFSVSATTRNKRHYEVDGEDYYFLTNADFQQRIQNQQFLEFEEVYAGTLYGTLKSEVNRIWEQDCSVIFDVDVKGAETIKNYYGNSALAVFVRPPSYEILEERLILRNTESESSLKKRLERVKLEMTYESKFDYSLVNDDLNIAKEEAFKVVDEFLNKII
ncbi:UNVERIFIED_CONTAM: hypothetical protein GTU68_049500 [Idotea baltica]|nr:hypothetical protein [Idotea baltica]